MGAYWGIFPSTLLQYSQPVYLRQGSPSSCSSGCFSQFYTHLLSHVFQMCESISVFAHKQACMLSVFALGSYNIRSQISTRFPGFQAKPSPHSTTFDTWVPAHFELIQDEAMQDLGRIAASRHQSEEGQCSSPCLLQTGRKKSLTELVLLGPIESPSSTAP